MLIPFKLTISLGSWHLGSLGTGSKKRLEREREIETTNKRECHFGSKLIRDSGFAGDDDVADTAARQNGATLPELWADQSFLEEAAKSNWQVLKFAGPDVWANRDLLLSIAKQSNQILKHARAELRADREFVLNFVRRRGNALVWAAPALKADRQVVLEAVRHDESAFEFASLELRSDWELMLLARSCKRQFEECRQQLTDVHHLKRSLEAVSKIPSMDPIWTQYGSNMDPTWTQAVCSCSCMPHDRADQGTD